MGNFNAAYTGTLGIGFAALTFVFGWWILAFVASTVRAIARG